MARSTRAPRKTGRSRTAERRNATARTDAELRARAARIIADDPDQVADFARQAIEGMSARILGYSLRNQVMLMDQAAARGITLTDVDTFPGWVGRGRVPRRGETGLRITRFRGGPGAEPADDERTDAERVRAPRRFGMLAVFDVSQTDAAQATGRCDVCGTTTADKACGTGCTCAACEGDSQAHPNDPAELLADTLAEQILAAGYGIEHADPRPGDQPAEVDHEARSLRISAPAASEGDDAGALASGLAQIIAHRDEARAAAQRVPQAATA